MSSVPPSMVLRGNADANLLNMVPGGGQGSGGIPGGKPPVCKQKPIAPKLMPDNIDYSTHRNVLPCKGITHHVLRPQPPPATAGMLPIGGNSRHGLPSMSQFGPLDLPIMPFSDPFNSRFNNPLGTPA